MARTWTVLNAFKTAYDNKDRAALAAALEALNASKKSCHAVAK